MKKPLSFKKQEPKQPTRTWCGWIIDLAVGSHFVMLGMRSPALAEKLQKIMIKYLRDTYTLEKYTDNRKLFIEESINNLNHLYWTFVTAKLEIYLKDKCPEVPKIIMPGSGLEH